jgi:hypothetical protein
MLVAIKIEESTYAGKNHDGIVTGGWLDDDKTSV